MQKDTAHKKYATPGQILEIVNSTSSALGKALNEGKLTHYQAQTIIGGKTSWITSTAEGVAKNFLNMSLDPFTERKKKIFKFFEDVFRLRLNIHDFVIPEIKEFDGLMFNPVEFLHADAILAGYQRLGEMREKEFLHYLDIQNREISQAIVEQQYRPKYLYPFLFRTASSADPIHVGKSLNQAILQGTQVMTISERLLAELFLMYENEKYARWEDASRNENMCVTSSIINTEHLSVQTRSCIMTYYNNGKLKIRDCSPDTKMDNQAPREVVLV